MLMELGQIDTGGLLALVAEVEVFDPCHDWHLLWMEYVGTLFVFCGLLVGEAALVTLVDAVVVTPIPMQLLERGQNTKVLYYTPHTRNDLFKVVDVCSGLGGISHGELSVGVQTVYAADYNSKMLESHKAHSGADVVLGSVGCLQIVTVLFQRSTHTALLCAGYSCQPFSQLGDKRGGNAPRSQSLPKALRATMWMQSCIVILECVVPARNDPVVAQVLNQFVSLTGFWKEVVTVVLAMIWPCRCNRARWPLHDPILSAIGLKECLKVEDLPMIQCLIPYICKWDPRDELVTMIEAAFACKFPVPLLDCGPSMKVLFYTLHTGSAFYNLIGASCGMAGLMHGALAVGVASMVATDCSAFLLELLKIWPGGCKGGNVPHAQEVTLDFQGVWLCGRHRSWCIVCESCLGSFGLAEWCTLQGPLVILCLSPLDNGLSLPVASSSDALSSQGIWTVHPSAVLFLNRDGRQASITYRCGVGGSKAAKVEKISLLMVMYTILGFCVALRPSRVQVAVQFRLLTRLQFLSVCRIGGALRPGPKGGCSHVVMGSAFPTGSRCKATFVDLCSSCLVMPWCAQGRDNAGNWIMMFSRTSLCRLSKALDGFCHS